MINFLKEVWAVSWGDFVYMKHNLVSILIMSITGPLLYLVAFGYGLRSGTTDIGVSYVTFVIPGIVALSTLSTSFSATSARMNVQRLYHRCFDEMMMCPLSLNAIIIGKCMLGFIRGLIACSIMFTLGLFLAPELELTLEFIISLLLSCMVFSMLGMSAALMAKSHATLATFNSLVILPMTFLCGTFFSVNSLDVKLEALLYCLPLTHSSQCIRAATLPDYLGFPWFSLIVLALFGVAFFLINRHLLKAMKV